MCIMRKNNNWKIHVVDEIGCSCRTLKSDAILVGAVAVALSRRRCDSFRFSVCHTSFSLQSSIPGETVARFYVFAEMCFSIFK